MRISDWSSDVCSSDLWLDEALRSPLREFFDEGFCIAAFGAKVHYRSNTLHLASRPYIRYSRLLLPLSDDGLRMDHLLGCIKVDGAINTRSPSVVEEQEITIRNRQSTRLHSSH